MQGELLLKEHSERIQNVENEIHLFKETREATCPLAKRFADKKTQRNMAIGQIVQILMLGTTLLTMLFRG